MQTPVEMEFQEMAVSPAAQELVADHVKKLEQRYGRITACRIAVKGPGNRHQSGGLYDVNIRLALPDGREVNVGRTPTADERRPIWRSPSMMRSNGRAGGSRITRAACRG